MRVESTIRAARASRPGPALFSPPTPTASGRQVSGFRVQGSGFRVQIVDLQGSGFRLSPFRVQGSDCRPSGFRVVRKARAFLRPPPHTLNPRYVRLPRKGNSKAHGARPVHLISMMKSIRTSRLSTKNFLSLEHQLLRDARLPPASVSRVYRVTSRIRNTHPRWIAIGP